MKFAVQKRLSAAGAKILPEPDAERFTPVAGVRAQAVSPQGKLIDDFLFVTTARSIHTCNAPSPAATSAIPIGAHIVSKVQTLLASQSNPGRTLRAARSVETLHAAFTR